MIRKLLISTFAVCFIVLFNMELTYAESTSNKGNNVSFQELNVKFDSMNEKLEKLLNRSLAVTCSNSCSSNGESTSCSDTNCSDCNGAKSCVINSNGTTCTTGCQ